MGECRFRTGFVLFGFFRVVPGFLRVKTRIFCLGGGDLGQFARFVPRHQRRNAGQPCDHRHNCGTRDQLFQSTGGTLLLFHTKLLDFSQLLCLFQLALSSRLSRLFLGDARLLADFEKMDRRIKTGPVTLGPCGVGTFCLAPGQRDSQLGVAVQASFPLFVQIGTFRQPMINSRRLSFFFNPLPQAVPDAHQAFVRNVDDCLIGQFDLGRRHQERDTALPISVDHRPQFLRRHLQYLTQTTQSLRTPDAPAVRFLDRQCLKDPFAQVTLAVAGQ